MLRELAVHNFALIEDVRVELHPGFCAWTGETGAGKSLFLGALGLLLGQRGSIDYIRAGEQELRVTGRFELVRPELRQTVERILDHPLDDSEIILSRRFHRQGSSKAYVNESPVSLSTLKRLGEVLVDIHSQRDNYSLLEPGYQLELLDAFGQLNQERERYLLLADKVRRLRHRYQELSTEQYSRQRELTLLRFEREELEAAQLQSGEMEQLTQEREQLVHAQALQSYSSRCADWLYDEEGSIAERLGKLAKEGQSWSTIDPQLGEAISRLENLVPEVRELASTFRHRSDGYEADPARLEEIEKRLHFLRRLETRYRRSLEELIVYRDSLLQPEASLECQEAEMSRTHHELATTFLELKQSAAVLSKSRCKVAKRLVAETEKHLVQLGMPHARLKAELISVSIGEDPFESGIPPWGAEQLEIMLVANPGQPPLPLRKIASGGELSRTMLALKSVLAAHDPVGTMIFDEIDANVGGRLGDILGAKLALLGQTHQVICVTHLPQVASYAGHQWTIRKAARGKRTFTQITELVTDAERIEELALMLRGESRGETTMQEASAMLSAPRKHRESRSNLCSYADTALPSSAK